MKKVRPKKNYRIRKAPFFLISAFLLLLLAGILTEEPSRVLEQAINICLSCIGIG